MSPPTEKKNNPTGDASGRRTAFRTLRGVKAAIETFANKIGSAPAALTAQFGRNDSRSSFSNAEEKARHELHFGASASMGEPAKKGGAAQRAAPRLLQDR